MVEIAVIGGGVIGCAVGLELRRRGAAATVIDRNGDVGHGSTSASCGIVRRFYSTPTMAAMAEEGARVWADWSAHLGVKDPLGMARFERPGMLFIPPRIDPGVERILAHMRAVGVEVELLDRDAIRARFPFFSVDSMSPVRSPEQDDFFESSGRQIEGAVYEPDAGYVVSPQVAAHNLRVAGEANGVRFLLGKPVRAIVREEDGFRLEIEGRDDVRVDAVVNVGGPHSTVINRMAGVRLPIETRPLRRETHAVPNRQFTEEGGSAVPVVGDVDSGIYFRPEAGGRDLIVGSLDPQCDVLEWVDDPDALDPQTTQPAFERQVMRLMKRMDCVELGRRRGVVGMYDVMPLDWNPILDVTDLPGFYVAIGTSGSSFKTAPVIGQAMAELVLSCQGGRDHDREPVRFRLPRTGFEVDLSFFSRLRGAHHSSGTVLG